MATGNSQGWEQQAAGLTEQARDLQTASQKVHSDAAALPILSDPHLEPLLLREPWTRQQQQVVAASALWVLLVGLGISLRLRALKRRSR